MNCRHCHQPVVVDTPPKEDAHPTEWVLAGAGWCERCRSVLCSTCNSREPHQINYDCVCKDRE